MKRATYPKIIVIAVASLLVIFYSSHDIGAREGQMKFEQVLDIGKELTSTFMQDRDGFFWMGSATSGLLRFDGISIEYFKAGPGSVSDNNIVQIFEDSNGILWLATLGNGLNSYNKLTDTFTYYKHDPANPKTISSNSCNWIDGLILEDSEGFIWIGTADGLNRFDTKTKTFTSYKHDPDNPKSLSNNSIFAIIEDRNGFIWIGTADGLNRFDTKTKTFTRYKHDPNKNSLGNNNIRTVYEDRDGFIWIGTEAVQLDKYDPNTDTFKNYRHDPINPLSLPENMRIYSIYEDKSGKLFLTSAHNPVGYAVFDKKYETFTHYKKNSKNPGTLSSDAVVKFYEDRQGVLWALNLMGAIDKYDTKSRKFKTYANIPNDSASLKGNTVINLYEDTQGTVWVGTFTGGLNKFDKKTETFEHFEHDPNDPKTIRNPYNVTNFEDSSGTFWVSTFENLSIFDREKGYCSLHTDVKCVYGILEDSDNPNILWLGTFKYGLYKYFRDSNTFVQYLNEPDIPLSLSNNIPIALYEDNDDSNILWIGTLGGGLDRFDKRTEIFTHYKHEPDNPNSLSSNSIWDIYVDIRGNFWIATSDGGLNLFDKTKGTFVRYTTQNGFPSDNVLTILEDDNGRLWMGTNIGLVKFNPETGENRLYNESDGLPGGSFLQFAKLKSADGELWFGGPQGVVKFHPDKIRDNEFIPPVYLTSLSQGGEEMRLGKAFEKVREIELDWQNNYFEFEYIALNYTHSEKNRYRYILEGLDKDWYNAGTLKHGRYSGLPGGTYTLKIQGSNNDGVWNEKGTAIIVRVVPPFWQTLWFYVLLGMIVLATVLFVLFYLNKLNSEISERKKTEKALVRFATIIEQAYEEVVITDPTGIIQYVNPSFEENTGYSKKEAIGQTPAILKSHLHDSKFYKEMWTTLLEKKIWKGTIHNKAKNGQMILHDMGITPILNSKNEISAFVSIRRDITQQAKMEQQIRQSQKTEAIGTLAGGIAHDFNNILSGIFGYTQLAEMHLENPEKARGHLDQVVKGAQRASDLVQQILTFSRQTEQKKQSFRLYLVVKEAIKFLRSSIPSTIEMQEEISSNAMIYADSTQAHQVVINICTNAYHAMIHSGGTLTVKLDDIIIQAGTHTPSNAHPGKYVKLEVQDTGLGMDKQTLAKIFDPYFTTKEPDKGTGLGLAMVDGIVQKHGGFIKVKSTVGFGSTFQIFWPVFSKENGGNHKKREKTKPLQGSEQIMLVDDEQGILDTLQAILEKQGYKITSFNTSQSALEAFKENPNQFDLVITDMTMPQLTGEELAIQILNIRKEMPIILCTGFHESINAEKTHKIGISKFVEKPITGNEICDLVQEVLKR